MFGKSTVVLEDGCIFTSFSGNFILTATSQISDGISQLSATSEEIAASSTEGLQTTNDSVDKMKSCGEKLMEIYNEAQNLTK